MIVTEHLNAGQAQISARRLSGRGASRLGDLQRREAPAARLADVPTQPAALAPASSWSDPALEHKRIHGCAAHREHVDLRRHDAPASAASTTLS